VEQVVWGPSDGVRLPSPANDLVGDFLPGRRFHRLERPRLYRDGQLPRPYASSGSVSRRAALRRAW